MIANSKNIPNFAAAKAIGVWCSWLAFLHGVQAVARSSRATPTVKKQLMTQLLFLCLLGLLRKKSFQNLFQINLQNLLKIKSVELFYRKIQ